VAAIERHEYIPMRDIIIDRFQARKSKAGEALEELAASIKKYGLLHPIGLCRSARDPKKWEVIFGQRRYLAHKFLQRDKIMAGLADRVLSKEEGLAISANENLLVAPMVRKDIIDLCEELYRKYGTIKDVAEETKIPYYLVRKHIRYSGLPDDLQSKVDDKEINVDLAMKVQDAASASGSYDKEEAEQLIDVLKTVDNPIQRKVLNLRKNNPTVSLEKIVKKAEEPEKTLKVALTLGETLSNGVRQFAEDQDTDTDTAAEELIEKGLYIEGYLSE
jgi:ParB family chromosome partitioning protein